MAQRRAVRPARKRRTVTPRGRMARRRRSAAARRDGAARHERGHQPVLDELDVPDRGCQWPCPASPPSTGRGSSPGITRAQHRRGRTARRRSGRCRSRAIWPPCSGRGTRSSDPGPARLVQVRGAQHDEGHCARADRAGGAVGCLHRAPGTGRRGQGAGVRRSHRHVDAPPSMEAQESRCGQYWPLITKNEPRIVPASFDFCRANLNASSSAGTSIPSESLNPTARFLASSTVYSTLTDRPLS